MSLIVPTITTDNQAEFDANLAAFKAFAPRVQIDASDGTFAPTVMVPISDMRPVPDLAIDLHVMSARPSDHLSAILALKPSLCILHAEVDDDLAGIFTQLKAAEIKTGLALLRGTFPGKVANLISAVDHVMIFAGELGKQGGAIDMLQTEKVALIRAIQPDVEIGWDGGANLSNVRALAHAGIDVINVGSAITQAADKAAMYQSLLAETEKLGVLI